MREVLQLPHNPHIHGPDPKDEVMGGVNFQTDITWILDHTN